MVAKKKQAKQKGKAKGKKSDKPKQLRPPKVITIGKSPIRWGKKGKPKTLTKDMLVELDVCHEGMVWMSNYAPRGVPLSSKGIIALIERPGAMLTLNPAWMGTLLQSVCIRLVSRAGTTDSEHYKKIQGHVASVLMSYHREATRIGQDYAQLRDLGKGSETEFHANVVRCALKHWDKL